MFFQKSIELTLQQKFQIEKITRTINDCDDIETLRAIAIELVELNQKKTAIANFSTRLAWQAEHGKLSRE